MPGPPPKKPDERRRRNVPAGGEWCPAPGVGWQHGKTPRCPAGLTDGAQEAWRTWMGSWMASFWLPEDLPVLKRLVKMYDECERLELNQFNDTLEIDEVFRSRPPIPYGELRQLSDRFGLSPAARQKLRWLPPVEESGTSAAKKSRRYGHLEAV